MMIVPLLCRNESGDRLRSPYVVLALKSGSRFSKEGKLADSLGHDDLLRC